MRDIEACLDDIKDEKYAYTETLLEYVDADKVESLLRGMCQAMELKSPEDALVFGMCLANSINSALQERAERWQDKTKSPLFETFNEIMADFDELIKKKDMA